MPMHKQAVVRNSSKAIGLPSKVKMDPVVHTTCKYNGLTQTPNEIQNAHSKRFSSVQEFKPNNKPVGDCV